MLGTVPAPDLDALRSFRFTLHGCFYRHADALCEFVDALLTAKAVTSLPHRSLQAGNHSWGSVYVGVASNPRSINGYPHKYLRGQGVDTDAREGWQCATPLINFRVVIPLSWGA